MGAREITASEVSRLTKELEAKDAQLLAMDAEVRQLRVDKIALLEEKITLLEDLSAKVRQFREDKVALLEEKITLLDDLSVAKKFEEVRQLREDKIALLQDKIAQLEDLSAAKMFQESAVALRQASDLAIVELTNMVSRLQRERVGRQEVQDRLDRLMNHVTMQVVMLRDAYHRGSSAMPAIRLNPFDHPVDFNNLSLPDLTSFFSFLSHELIRLHEVVGEAVEKDGVRAAVAVAGRILFGLRHRNPSVPLDAVFNELSPGDRERAFRAVAPCITAVVCLEKQRDYGGLV